MKRFSFIYNKKVINEKYIEILFIIYYIGKKFKFNKYFVEIFMEK